MPSATSTTSPAASETPQRAAMPDGVDERGGPQAQPERHAVAAPVCSTAAPSATPDSPSPARRSAIGEGCTNGCTPDGEHDTDERQRHGIAAGGEAREDEADESDDHEHEPEHHRARRSTLPVAVM